MSIVMVGGNKCMERRYLDACEKYEKCFRSNDDCNKIYREGRDWDNDNHSASFYLIIGAIILIITIIMFLFNRDLY